MPRSLFRGAVTNIGALPYKDKRALTFSHILVYERPPLPVLVCLDTPVGVVKYYRLDPVDPADVYVTTRTERHPE